MFFGLVAEGFDGSEGGVGFEQGVIDTAGEGLRGAQHMGDVHVIMCRAQGVGNGDVGAGEQFGVGGHVGNDIRAG